MKRILTASLALVLAIGAAMRAAEAPPKMPDPAKEHLWLQQFVGQWEANVEMYMEPGKPPQVSKGQETVRSLGEFWTVADFKGTFTDKPFTGMMTLGYDPQKKKYVGFWVDSASSQLWKYEGTVDATSKILTLESEGYCPHTPGKLSKCRDVLEIKGKNHRTLTGSMQGEDGEWSVGLKVDHHRKP